MPTEKQIAPLTGALEDYLETVYELVRDKKLARIKDIAKARGVKSGSVSPAMRRLSDMGLVNYVEREYIDLTPEGERLARRVYAKHQVLSRFFAGVLNMPREAAVENACAMEHSLSDEGMEHLVRFFEFLEGCPDGSQFLERFHQCALVQPNKDGCDRDCPRREAMRGPEGGQVVSLARLRPGESGAVFQIEGSESIRQSLLDKGLVPNAKITVNRMQQDGLIIILEGFEVLLTFENAEAVLVVYSDTPSPQTRRQES